MSKRAGIRATAVLLAALAAPAAYADTGLLDCVKNWFRHEVCPPVTQTTKPPQTPEHPAPKKHVPSPLDRIVAMPYATGEFCKGNDAIYFHADVTPEQAAKGYTARFEPTSTTPGYQRTLMSGNVTLHRTMNRLVAPDADGVRRVTLDAQVSLYHYNHRVNTLKVHPTIWAPECGTQQPAPEPRAPEAQPTPEVPGTTPGTVPQGNAPLGSAPSGNVPPPNVPKPTNWRAEYQIGHFDMNIRDVSQTGKINVFNYSGKKQGALIGYQGQKDDFRAYAAMYNGNTKVFCPLGAMNITTYGVTENHTFFDKADKKDSGFTIRPDLGVGFEGQTIQFKDIGRSYNSTTPMMSLNLRIADKDGYAGSWFRVGGMAFMQDQQLVNNFAPNGWSNKAAAFRELGYGPAVAGQLRMNNFLWLEGNGNVYQRKSMQADPTQQGKGTGSAYNIDMKAALPHHWDLKFGIQGSSDNTKIPQGVSPMTSGTAYYGIVGFHF